MTPLAQYIEAQLKNGYASSQIKQYLIQQGYNQKDVETALAELNQTQQIRSPPTQAQTVTPTPTSQDAIKTQLASYVLTYIQQGYQADQLFEYLKGQGYNKKTLKEVFEQINTQYYQGQMKSSPVQEHTVSSSSIMKVGLMLIIVAILVGGGYFFAQNLLFGSGGDKLLDVEVTPIKTTLMEGDSLGFNVDLISQGAEGRVDAFFDYVIRDKNSKIILKEEDTKAFDTTMSFQKKISLPDLSTGLYSLKVIARYGEKMADSTFTFSFQAAAEDVVPEIPDEPINVIKDESSNVLNNNDAKTKPTNEPVVAEDAKGKTDQDLFDYAVNQENKDTALSYCKGISAESLMTECYYAVAQQSQDSEVCRLINTTDRKEDCFMNFVMLGDVKLCEEVTLSENKILCNQFTQLSKIKGYMETDDQKGLKDYMGVPDYESQRPTEEEVANKDPTLDDFSIGDVVNNN